MSAPLEPNYGELLKPDLTQTNYPSLSRDAANSTLSNYVPLSQQQTMTRVVVIRESAPVAPAAGPIDTTPREAVSGLWNSLKAVGRSIVSTVVQPTLNNNSTANKAESTAANSQTIASAPPPDEVPSVLAGPITIQSLVQMVYNKTPVDVLSRYGCNTNSLLQLGMSLNNFFDRGYSLQEVNALVPEYNQMRQLGLCVQHFTSSSNPWSIVEFSNLYNIPLKTLLRAPTGFDMSPRDLVSAGLKSAHLADANITARELIDRKATFSFWFQLQATPSDFAQLLKGGLDELADLGFSTEQKRAMEQYGWTVRSIRAIDDIKLETAHRIWSA